MSDEQLEDQPFENQQPGHQPVPTPASRSFQINEADMIDLERILPMWFDRLYGQMDNKTRVQMRRVQQILANVRWGYGPPREVTTIPADEL